MFRFLPLIFFAACSISNNRVRFEKKPLDYSIRSELLNDGSVLVMLKGQPGVSKGEILFDLNTTASNLCQGGVYDLTIVSQEAEEVMVRQAWAKGVVHINPRQYDLKQTKYSLVVRVRCYWKGK
jgi:tagatose-1,6-bisphosphate aldolase non-catalytic subunit AgaZ/GatZ